MSDFQAARDALETGLSDASPATDTSNSSNQDTREGQAGPQAQAQVIQELEKLEKFKYQGQEWTAKDLEKAILRQKDYTQKTQGLAKERKSLEDEGKYYSALAWDLIKLRENPQLINEFVKVYPEKFHSIAEEYLNQANTQNNQASQNVQQQQPKHDVQTLSRLEKLEKFYNEQEIEKNELQIGQIMEQLSTKYPSADKENVLARALEIHSGGTNLSQETWEDIFKQVHEREEGKFQARYSDYVKKQKEANAKSKDVGAGGGTAGGAPKKFKNLGEVRDFAIQDLTGRGR